MRNIAIIPARSGSKGLKDKNIRLLNGKPLIAYSIEAAIGSGCFNTVHVSTDSVYYAEIAQRYGAEIPFLRNAETSSDSASSWDVVIEVLQKYAEQGQSYDSVMILQPTSPLRTIEDIQKGYQIMKEKQAEAVVSICETEYSPLWCNTLPASGCMDGFISSDMLRPRQQLETYYRVNGAIYLISTRKLQTDRKLLYDESCYAYIMPKNRSVDIDDEFDFMLAEFIMKKNKQ